MATEAAARAATIADAKDSLRIGSHTFASRLIVGTGKYATYDLMRDALDASGTNCVTVAVRRERLIDADGNNLIDFLDCQRYTLLPNTAGCCRVLRC
jgi:thiazole synthase